jgi:hypothetical protein
VRERVVRLNQCQLNSMYSEVTWWPSSDAVLFNSLASTWLTSMKGQSGKSPEVADDDCYRSSEEDANTTRCTAGGGRAISARGALVCEGQHAKLQLSYPNLAFLSFLPSTILWVSPESQVIGPKYQGRRLTRQSQHTPLAAYTRPAHRNVVIDIDLTKVQEGVL